MLACFVNAASSSIPITFVTRDSYPAWLQVQPAATQAWFAAFQLEAGAFKLLPHWQTGNIERVVCCLQSSEDYLSVGALPLALPESNYHFADSQPETFALAWGLGAYQFSRYKKPSRKPAALLWQAQWQAVHDQIQAIYLVRDCVNTPADDMGPRELAAITRHLAQNYQAQLTECAGEELLEANYPCIYTVGRASDDAPRLLDLRWGNPTHPKVTLVGKGVCFDTGGLDIKAANYMQLMKKDMGGAANVLGLAQMIMAAKLPINLRVLIPAVENAIGGNAYRPGDVIISRKGLSIEVGNTDAEGRLVLADAITEAVSEKPDLIIDIATLTGAARVALGPDLPVVFSSHETLVNDVIRHGNQVQDPLWRLPLFAPYRDYIKSNIADINNNSVEPYAGAITAALFLKEFVPDTQPWLHFDIMSWNIRARPSKPAGGEAMAIRALFSYLKERYC